MKYTAIIFFWLLFISLSYSQCNYNNQKNYSYNLNNSVTLYILLNYSFLLSDIDAKNGDYLDSLLTQLNLPNNDKTLNYLIELVNSSKNSYDFAMALTKDKN